MSWDQEMNELLYDVRRDAIRKFHEAEEKDCKPLIEAIKRVVEMSNIARKEGLLALEDIIVEGGMECTENFLFLLSDFKNGLDYIYEIASNEYWTRNLQGVQAMIFYIYFRGAVSIFMGENPRIIDAMNISLLPEEYPRNEDWLNDYVDNEKPLIRYTAQKQEKIDLERKEWEKRYEKEKIKEKQEKQELKKFCSTPHNFKNPKLPEKLRELEKEILENLSDQSINTLLDFEEGRDNMINRCLYGLGNEARMKIVKCIGCCNDKDILVPEESARMRRVMELGEQEEEEILGAVLMTLGTIKRLRRTGKIVE